MKSFSVSQSAGIGPSACGWGAYIVPDGGIVMFSHIHVVGICSEGWADPHEAAGPGPHGACSARGGQRLTVK